MASASQHHETEASDAAAMEVDVGWLFPEPPAEARGNRLQTGSVGRGQDPAVTSAAAAAVSLVRQPLGSAARRSVEAGPGLSIRSHGGPGPSTRGPGPSTRGPGPSTRPHHGRAATASARTPRPRNRTRPGGLDTATLVRFLEWQDEYEEKRGSKLMRAAKKGALEEVRAELAAGADTEVEDDMLGYTALHLAAQYGQAEVVRCLLESGAKVRATGLLRYTPLHAAADNCEAVGGDGGRAAAVRVLVAASADPNARAYGGQTPLHHAAENGYVEVAAALLDAGADRRARDREGRTPLDMARRNNHRQLVEMLM